MRNKTQGIQRRIVPFICAVLYLTLFQPLYSNASMPLKERFKTVNTIKTDNSEEIQSYIKVKQLYLEKGYKDYTGQNIVIDSTKPTAVHSNPKQENDALVWEDGMEWFDYKLDIQQEGLYEIATDYLPLQGKGNSIQRSISIDGKIPFLEAYNIVFSRMWNNKGEAKINNIGDEVRQRQEEIRTWSNITLCDNQGLSSEPLKFYFSAGSHVIRMGFVDEPVAFKNITLKAPEKLLNYNDIKEQYAKNGYKTASKTIKFQAEKNIAYKSDSVLRSEYDTDPKTEPAATENRKLNIVGGWGWRYGGQEITWKFNVEEDGLYRISARIGQWWGDGQPSYRQIKLDGKVPFAELNEYKFDYQKDWNMLTIGKSNEEPFLFYLTKGEHNISMKAVMGAYATVAQGVMEDTIELSEWYRKIIMLTGRTPDMNYEYELGKNIPGLTNSFKKMAQRMKEKADVLIKISSKRPSIANNFIVISEQLSSMAENPDTISRKLNELNNAQTSLGAYIMELKMKPLAVDYFVISPEKAQLQNATSNFFDKMYLTVVNFFKSFTKDYDSVGSVSAQSESEKPALNIWVGRGKEWAELIKQMADEDFTAKTGIKINMNVLPAGQLHAGSVNALMLAVTSGKAPDIACGVDINSPVEFAIRNSAYDLTKFSDYNEIEKRFYPTIMVPFKYKSGVYALPDQMEFNVLLYRKDILKDLGVTIPNTWKEVYEKVLPVLYQNGMQFAPSGYPLFLFQLGGEYYTPDGRKSALNSPIAYKSFKEWTDQYISMGMPVEANFFNRFRNGEMPMGIVGYGEYIRLTTAAPELYGRWDISMVPGHEREDGTIDRSIGAITGQNTMILSQSKYKPEAWEFLKWWTSKEVQSQYGRELESLLGVEARWNTANIEAFRASTWDKRHRDIILEQLTWAKEQPVVLGGYFTGRHVNNAWTRVVTGGVTARDSLEQAVKDINKELLAKQEEYGEIKK